MARFASAPALPPTAPYSLGPRPAPAVTHEGGAGYVASDPRVALFNAAVSGMLADQFYESGDKRIETLVALVPQCDPAWLREFIPWLRSGANLRSAPVVLAAEYARHHPGGRQVVASALQRPDEPGELLGYWLSRYGRNVPKPVKRGIADAVVRLYTEAALLRYDGQGRGWRFGDVIEFVHPTPADPGQSALFRFALDRRRHDAVAHPGALPKVSRTLMVEGLPIDARRDALPTIAAARDVVFSWERLAGWLPGGMDAEAWQTVIPSMGYMALLRNLNNFDRAGVDAATVDSVRARLTDRAEVARSRVLPFRFLSAYSALEADTYKVAVGTAADLALANLPHFAGSTLIMVDCSGSMSNPVGAGKSRAPLTLSELAGFMAEALARRCAEALIVPYNTGIVAAFEPQRHVGVLRASVETHYRPDGGTSTWRCTEAVVVRRQFDRVVILTDEQTGDRDAGTVTAPVITWNLAGYQPHHASHGAARRFFVAGYSDTTLQTLPAVIGLGSTGRWPWE